MTMATPATPEISTSLTDVTFTSRLRAFVTIDSLTFPAHRRASSAAWGHDTPTRPSHGVAASEPWLMGQLKGVHGPCGASWKPL